MHLPDAHELISAWERGATQHWIDRALTLLALGYPRDDLCATRGPVDRSA
jgi:hypothetical protein